MFPYLPIYPIRFSSFSTTFLIAVILFNGSLFSQHPKLIFLNRQASSLQASVEPIIPSEIVFNTNLVLLLDQIRTLTKDGKLRDAQKVATTALENLNQSEQNEFYLRQIKAEETKLYFKLANQAMLNKEYSQASQYIERYRENVAEELQNRKIRREINR